MHLSPLRSWRRRQHHDYKDLTAEFAKEHTIQEMLQHFGCTEQVDGNKRSRATHLHV